MTFRPMKPETIKQHAEKRVANRIAAKAERIRRFRETMNAGRDPQGICAELLAEELAQG